MQRYDHHQRFWDAVKLSLRDLSGRISARLEHLPLLESEGSYEVVKRNLGSVLELDYRASRIEQEVYEQAH